MDLDLDGLDGFPVRFDDDDMDVLDLDAALAAPIPGSFADFAEWLASGHTGETKSSCVIRDNPVSADAMATQQPVNNMGQTRYEAPQAATEEQRQYQPEQQHWSTGLGMNVRSVKEQHQQQQHHHGQQQQDVVAASSSGTVRQQSLSQTQASTSPQQQQQQPLWLQQRSGSVSSQAVNEAATEALQQHYVQQQQQQQQQQQHQQQQNAAQVWPLPQQLMPTTQQQQYASATVASSAQHLLQPPASLGITSATAAGTSSMFQPASSAAATATAVSAGGTFSAGTARAQSFNLSLQPSGPLFLGHSMSLQPTVVLSPSPSTSVHSLAAAAAAASAAASAGLGGAGLVTGGMPGLGLGLSMGPMGAQHGQVQYNWQAAHHMARGDVLGPMMSPTAIFKQTAVSRQQKVRRRNTVASLEAELSEKMAQLQLLTAENEMLKLRAGVLEATVQNREDQMRIVWEHGPPTFPIDCPDTPGRGPPSRGPSSRSLQERVAAAGAAIGGGNGQQAPQLTAAASSQLASGWGEEGSAGAVPSPSTPNVNPGAVAAAAGGAATTLTATTSSGSSEGGASGGCGATADSPSSSSGSGPEDDNIFDAHTAQLPLPQQKDSLLCIKRMSDDDIIRHWKQFLQEVTSALVQLQREESAAAALGHVASKAAATMPGAAAGQEATSGKPISPAEQRVRDLVDKYCYLVRTAQTLNPSAYCRLFGRHLDTGEALPYNDQHWRNVVAVLGLDKDQITHILACAELYFSSRAKLQAEQRVLQVQLRAAEGQPLGLLSASGAGSPGAATGGGSSSEDNPLKPWLERLASNLKREHNLRIMLNSYVWGRIFTHLQKAKAAVYSHPLYVDIHALVCVMCEDALAAAGAPRGTAAQQQQQVQLQQQYAATYAACQQQLAYAEYMQGVMQQPVM